MVLFRENDTRKHHDGNHARNNEQSYEYVRNVLHDSFLSKILSLPENEIAQIIRIGRFGPNLENIRCSFCGSRNILRFGHKYNRANIRRYRCGKCKKIFNDLTGTPLNGSKISLKEWIIITYLSFIKRETIINISRILCRPYPTIWNAINRLKNTKEITSYIVNMLTLYKFLINK